MATDRPNAEDAASIQHLRARLEVLEGRVTEAVQARRARRPATADDRLRGVFLSDADIDLLLAAGGGVRPPPAVDTDLLVRVEAAVDAAEAEGQPTRLRRLQRGFGLAPLDVDILLAALAPDLDPRFERLYAYLQDDITRRRLTAGLSLELAGAGALDPVARAATGRTGRLVTSGLLTVEDAERPFLTRALRVPDRVTSYLLGDDEPGPDIEPYLTPTVPMAGEGWERVARAIEAGTRLFYAQERPGASGSALFGAALAAVGLRAVEVDLGVPESIVDLVPALLREAGLCQAGLILTRVDDVARRDLRTIRRLTRLPALVCLTGTYSWDPEWADSLPYVVDVPPPAREVRADLWRRLLAGVPALDEPEGVQTLAALRMKPREMIAVVDAAGQRARGEQREVRLADLEASARHVNSVSLEQLCTRIAPRASWADIVLAPPVARTIRKIAARARHRDLVQGEWGLRAHSRRQGIIALFSGPPGTGKTLAAEVIAGQLGVDLYVIDLATIVDKYIGETEKNLERIFTAAEQVNGLLFFDEADALFGKRSEVRDARDRYANIEVAYLLQRLERFDGVAVLATNLSANIDEAFSRRLDVSVDFRLPELPERRAIWQLSLPPALPVAEDVDRDFLATEFALSGGSIRNICVEAAYLAADDGGRVTMEHLIRATALEHRKLGRLLSSAEFKQFHEIGKHELAS